MQIARKFVRAHGCGHEFKQTPAMSSGAWRGLGGQHAVEEAISGLQLLAVVVVSPTLFSGCLQKSRRSALSTRSFRVGVPCPRLCVGMFSSTCPPKAVGMAPEV